MSKISLAPDASGTGIFTIASPNSNTNRTLTLPDDTGTIVTNSGNQAGSFTTLNTSGAVVFNDAGADVDFRVEGDTEIYKTTNAAVLYNQGVGGANHRWYNAPSGTAGDAITFTQAMTLDASGNVGIGVTPSTTSAGQSLEIDVVGSGLLSIGSTNLYTTSSVYYDAGFKYAVSGVPVSYYGQSSGTHTWHTFPAGTAGNAATGGEAMRINSSGNLLVGDTVNYPGGATTKVYFRNTLNDWVTALRNTNATPYGIRVDYSAFSPNGTGSQFLFCNDSTATRAEIRSNGGLANYSANNVNLSDERVKKDVENLGSQWNCIKEWNLVEFRYNEQADDAPKNYGVIAQQIQEHCPEVVQVFQEAKDAVEAKEAMLDEEGNIVEPAVEAQPAQEERIGVREQQMLWMAVKALQEAMERIETLEAKVAALEAK
jgi:hypothetical protein